MRTENSVIITVSPEVVFALGADVERWPVILPHYRYVRVLGGAAGRRPLPRVRTIAMSASRSGIPVRWTSTQSLEPVSGRILYHHVAGLTRGMDVVWEIEPVSHGTRVRILHDLPRPMGILRLPSGTWIAANVFIGYIAELTLAGIKRYAESLEQDSVR